MLQSLLNKKTFSFKICLLLSVFFLFSFSETSLKKRISDADFRYEFYTTDKTLSPKPERQYYWFKGGAIHNSEYGLAGELLHKDFFKFYHSNQLAETGKYNNGLKEGYWKTWFKNGVLQSNTYWDSGQKDGRYYAYDETGFLIEQGKYKNNKKHGRWVNYISKDTLKYRDGKIVVKKIKVKKVKDTLHNNRQGFLKRLFIKKQKDENVNSATPAVKKNNSGTEKKPGFFKRLFSKKEKKPKTNG
ncbi:toxin-antitoxin system YwqK family antitoxin [Flavobacterium sp. NRK1]|uniref:toxin-antitoxin system YwqK family antitoxin n=1 Tax=Flavobacterium sp. NRK1 TaxID=2954929 RepID=UPI0020939F93|nr:hypothetical protein [Flavobacterium sp. NRK1]MCO6147924.1 hypothetical protein [Flavobacterium sp. NRK1]